MGANGFTTIVGSVGGAILGMALGFTVVLTISGACYLAALFAMIKLSRNMRVGKSVEQALALAE